MTRAVIKYEGNFVLSTPILGAEPYLGRNLQNLVYRDRNMNAVFRAAEPFRVDFIAERYVEQARKLEEDTKKEAEEIEKRAKETDVKEVSDDLIKMAKILRRFRIIGRDTTVIKEKESFNQQVYFEYDVRRNFGLIYFVSTSQVNKPVKLEKNKPVKLEKVLAELNGRDICISF